MINLNDKRIAYALEELTPSAQQKIRAEPKIIADLPQDTPNMRFVRRREMTVDYDKQRIFYYPENEKNELRYQFFSGLYEDAFWIKVPLSPDGYWVHGNIYHDFMSTEEMARIKRIKQLGNFYGIYCHTRLVHSILTAIFMEAVLTIEGFDESQINLGIVSGLLHDIAIPAFSDEGKLANEDELDEEENIRHIIRKSKKLKRLFRLYNIDADEVVACVQGRYPIVGELLNSKGIDVDKISYTLLDAENSFYNRNVQPFYDFSFFIPEKMEDGSYSIHEDIRIEKGKVFFINPQRAGDFLELRARMYANCYSSPDNVERRKYLKTVLKDAWDQGIITRESMISLNDDELEDLLKTRISYKQMVSEIIPYSPHFAVTEPIVKPKFNLALETLVLHEGKIVPFSQAFPKRAAEIRRIAS